MDIYERLKKSGYKCTDDDLIILGLMEKERNPEMMTEEELSKTYGLQCYMFCGDCIWFDDDDTDCGISSRPIYRGNKLIRFNILFIETWGNKA